MVNLKKKRVALSPLAIKSYGLVAADVA